MRWRLALAGLAVVAAAGGCRKSDRAPDPQGSAAPLAAVVIDVAAVNALVPPELKDKLVFERRELKTLRGKRQGTYEFAAPASWVQSSNHFAHMRPSGSMSPAPRLEISTNCDGPCAPKPWELIADRVNFAPLAKGKVLKDEHLAGRRTMIAEVSADTGAAAAAASAAAAAGSASPSAGTGAAAAAPGSASPSAGTPSPSAGTPSPAAGTPSAAAGASPSAGSGSAANGSATGVAAAPTGATITNVVVAWWNDGDRNYHICTVLLDDALKAAAPAFDKACQAIAITGDD